MSQNFGLKDKKILLFITKSNFGGAQRYVYNLACELREQVGEVGVIFGGHGVLADRLKKEDVKTITIPRLQRDINFLKDILVFIDLVKIFWKEEADIIHLNSSKAGGLGALAVRFCNISRRIRGFLKKREYKTSKIVFTSHGWAFNEPRNFFSKSLIAFIYWIIIMLSDSVLTVSYAAKKQVSKFLFVKNKLKVVHIGTRPPELCSREYARDFLGDKIVEITGKNFEKKKIDALWIGTISELHPIKGLGVAVDAIAEVVKKYPEIIFVIIGEEGQERAKIENKISEKDLEENIFILGFIDHAPCYLPAFDIFTLTSYSEGLPYAVLEAGYAGLPVVASDVGGIPEVIKDGITGRLTIPGDSQFIANIIEKLIEDRELRKYLGDSLKGRVRRAFSVEKMTKETLKFYNTIIPID